MLSINKLFNRRKIFFYEVYILFLCCLIGSCKKYLDKKPVKTDVIPTKFADLQAVLDRYDNVNLKSPFLLEALSDNYFINSSDWGALPTEDRLNYIFDKDAFYNRAWVEPYGGPIYTSNVVLDQLPLISENPVNDLSYNNIKGSALFYRAFAFYELAQLYCRPYSSTASSDPGIVLRLTSNINVPSIRSSVEQTYQQILSDLKTAGELLPEVSLYPTRPNKAAAYGALARAYLSMRDYANAGVYANLALQRNGALLDFNTLIPVTSPPISRFNKEVIFHNAQPDNNPLLSNSIANIDTFLYQSYDSNDLRKTVFFEANNPTTFGFRASYEGAFSEYSTFDGIATDELYLIKAESLARSGNKDAALSALNTLLINRWKTGAFVPFDASSSQNALEIILSERRKELIYRGLRWTDLRRLNLEGYNINLIRKINGTTYTLSPNDPRWVLLIPPDVIKYAPNIVQNVR